MSNRANKAKRARFLARSFPRIKDKIDETFLYLAAMDVMSGHYRVTNDLGESFDFWETGTVGTFDGQYHKDSGNVFDIVVGQIDILVASSNKADEGEKI